MTLSPSLIWFLAGVVFLITELIFPGFILIFFTVGCWIAGVTVLLIDIDITIQVLVFIISSLVLLFTLRKYSLKIFSGGTSKYSADLYADNKIGKMAVVTKLIAPGVTGEIKVMGSFWRAVSKENIEEGKSVIIEGQESADFLTFKVKLL